MTKPATDVAHLARRVGFITLDKTWCEKVLGPRGKHYMTVNQIRKTGNWCQECERRYLAACRPPKNFEGRPK